MKIFQKIHLPLKNEEDRPERKTSPNPSQLPNLNQNQKLKQRNQNMRTTPKKTKNQFQWPRRRRADEQQEQNQWNWIDTLLQAKCFRFCSSSDTTKRMQGVTTMHRGLQTSDIINGTQKENRSSCNDKQSGDGTSCSYSQTECAEAYESCGSHETERRDSETHLCPQYADGVRQAARGELAAFRARCASLK